MYASTSLGAPHHMSPYFSSFVSLSHGSPVTVISASDTPTHVKGVGYVVTLRISLPNVYYTRL